MVNLGIYWVCMVENLQEVSHRQDSEKGIRHERDNNGLPTSIEFSFNYTFKIVRTQQLEINKNQCV